MCHHRGDIPDWSTERTDAAERTTDDEPEEGPDFLNEEGADHEVLTDGGEGDE